MDEGARMVRVVFSTLLLSVALAAQATPQRPVPVLNGFRLDPAGIPTDEILRGGPPRDGIRALVDPRSVSAQEADWGEDEIVVGVVRGEEARAYPVAILNWHELVNDTLGGEPILVSYCPLCGTGIVFDRVVGGKSRTFGVSGLLYRSDLLLYDHDSESLWSQISSHAVAGPLTGKRLRLLRAEMVQWSDWRAKHPATTVLSRDTGHERPYERTPYVGYESSRDVWFPAPIDERYHPKMPTLGVRVPDGPARAYTAEEIVCAGGRVSENFEGRTLSVTYDAEDQVFRVEAPEELEVVEAYWFAWAAFHPSTSVYVSQNDCNASGVKVD
jgi:hypothetical protein